MEVTQVKGRVMGEEKIGERLVIESLLKFICGYIYVYIYIQIEEKFCGFRVRKVSMVAAAATP